VLKAAQATYPRAWLAVNDEMVDLSPVESAGVRSAAAGPTDPPLPDEERAGCCTMRAKRSPAQVSGAGRPVEPPAASAGYPARAEPRNCRVWCGSVPARWRRPSRISGIFAPVSRWPRRRPASAAALQTLAAASLAAKSTGDFGAATGNRWTMAGSAGADLPIRQGIRSCPNAPPPPRIRERRLVYATSCCATGAGSATTSPPDSTGATPRTS